MAATARTTEGEVLGRKRYRLERYLLQQGHTWTPRPRAPMSALDCLLMLRTFLDGREDPWGRFDGLSSEEIEDEAAWPGEPGLLWRAMCEVGYVDICDDGTFAYHDFFSFNGKAIKNRFKGRKQPCPFMAPRTMRPYRGEDPPRQTLGQSGGQSPGQCVRQSAEQSAGQSATSHSPSPSPCIQSGVEVEAPPQTPPPDSARPPLRVIPQGVPSEESTSGTGTWDASQVRDLEHLHRLMLTAAPNRKPPPPAKDGRDRQLFHGKRYIERVWDLDREAGNRILDNVKTTHAPPGQMLYHLAPSRFEQEKVYIWGRHLDVQNLGALIRTSLAYAWQDEMASLEKKAQRRRHREARV